jgi:selenocysteine lyase/cysteine desulfurase
MLGDRSLFPNLVTRAYLDHAAISPLSEPVRRAAHQVVDSFAERGVGAQLEWMEQQGRLRQKLASLIGAEPDSIAFVANTTRGVTDIALCIPWRAGDRVLLFKGEFPANVTPWQRAAELFGLEVIWLPCPSAHDEEAVWLDRVAHTLETSAPRVMAVSAVQFQTGLRMPLAALGGLCGRYGTELFVDAIQACGVVPIDVRRERIDYLACGSHKWLMGLEGVAFLYVAPERAGALVPRVAGWLSHDDALAFLFEGPGRLRYDRPIRRRADFVEGGMPNTTALAALEAAVDLLLQIGIENIRAHVGRYLDALEPELTGLGLSSCRARELARRSGIASFAAPADIDVIALHRAIDRRIVSCTTPDGLLRFSPHWPNALEEVPLVVAEIAAALERAR